ncbi:putative signal peptide protein [Mesorhizobium plurifarium]|uniref:Putative signal peptide protein n=1 Tax=Mesorhizobium plurifarium TaxID=69974 RepID=A0A090FV22_MESPL|nr:putative signal peptide protein [Mesorhizobium plurifarium]
MTRFLMATILAAVAMTIGAAPANAAAQCAARADIIKALGDKFHETEAGRGLINPNVVLEIFVSDQGSWTVLASDTKGQSCVLSVGEGWDSPTIRAAMPGA